MPLVKSPTCFEYQFDPEKSLEANLYEVVEHMKVPILSAANEGIGFKIKLEIDAEAMDAAEISNLIAQAQVDAVEIEENEKNPPLIPVSVDKTDGEVIFKRRQKTV